jgi:hypothetical protein
VEKAMQSQSDAPDEAPDRRRHALAQVELGVHLLVLGELHNEVRVARLALPDRRVKADDELNMDLVGLGQEEEPGDRGVQDLVVVRLAAQAEVREEHVDVVSATSEVERKRISEGAMVG